MLPERRRRIAVGMPGPHTAASAFGLLLRRQEPVLAVTSFGQRARGSRVRASSSIRHYGLLAKGPHAIDLDRLRALIAEQAGDDASEPEPAEPEAMALPARPCCGGRMRIIERFGRGRAPHTAAGLPLGFDTS